MKTVSENNELCKTLLNNCMDVIDAGHASQTLAEKNLPYLNAPAIGPLVQHALAAMLKKVQEQKISIEKLVEKMCHSPAKIFKIENSSFTREGSFADLVVEDSQFRWTVEKDNILAKFG